MNKKISLLALLCLAALQLPAALVVQSLHLNPGDLTLVDGNTLPSLAFNATATFAGNNEVVKLATGDQWEVTVYNHDTIPHGFAVKNIFAGTTIAAGDSFTTTLTFTSQGIFIYYDPLDYPRNTYLGAAGMICVETTGSNTAGRFYWNFKEHQSDWNTLLVNNQPVTWNTYDPDYFTINGLSKPDVQNDTTAVITGNVGDSLRIYMANTGMSVHPIHFHGYHCRILYDSRNRLTGWEKDTFPLHPMETMMLVLVPDKPGMFPVHDHNLFSQTGGLIYNNGMLIMMTIN